MVIIYHFVVKCEFQNTSPQVLPPVIKWKKDEHRVLRHKKFTVNRSKPISENYRVEA